MHWVGHRDTNVKLKYQFIQTGHGTNLQEFQKFTCVISPVERGFIMHIEHSSCHIVAYMHVKVRYSCTCLQQVGRRLLDS